MAFGQNVQFLTEKPTDNLSEIKSAVAAIEQDPSGIERVFSAIYTAAEKYRKYRQEDPVRNVMFVVFYRRDRQRLSPGWTRPSTSAVAMKFPSTSSAFPAPFGFRDTFVKYVDPDPNYDQTPKFLPVSQGPETLLPEMHSICNSSVAKIPIRWTPALAPTRSPGCAMKPAGFTSPCIRIGT